MDKLYVNDYIFNVAEGSYTLTNAEMCVCVCVCVLTVSITCLYTVR